jgi:proteasome lid subunit RPN8/RPN11
MSIFFKKREPEKRRFINNDDSNYHTFNLLKCYKNTAVAEVKISKESTADMQEWTEKSLARKPVPEVGGFLFGHFKKIDNTNFITYIEKFLPAKKIDFNSPVLLEFGTQVMLEVDDFATQNPDLMLVGWFHTHPGHGPFLSDTDLFTHDGFFKKITNLRLF